MDGILLVDKPKGWTSFDVVAKIRGILRKAQSPKPKAKSRDEKLSAPSPKVKVGHTGTLDPLATGLLVLLLGSYTKKAPELSKLDKTYEVTMELGKVSSTGDSEGILTVPEYAKNFMLSHKKVSELTENIPKVMEQFVGEIEQVPPAYSAVKVGGQRAYKLARAGQEVKLEPRKVTIYEIADVEYEYPNVKFTARVSSGTYIRSLVEDIGIKLGTGAYMSDLRRTKVGRFSIVDSLPIHELTSETLARRVMLA